jgi:hypothetical protein
MTILLLLLLEPAIAALIPTSIPTVDFKTPLSYVTDKIDIPAIANGYTDYIDGIPNGRFKCSGKRYNVYFNLVDARLGFAHKCLGLAPYDNWASGKPVAIVVVTNLFLHWVGRRWMRRTVLKF